MTDAAYAPSNLSRFDRGPIADSASPRTVCVAFALAVAVSVGAWILDPHPAKVRNAEPAPVVPPVASVVPAIASVASAVASVPQAAGPEQTVDVTPATAAVSTAATSPTAETAPAPAAVATLANAAPDAYAALLDPALTLGLTPAPLAQSFPLGAGFERAAAPEPAPAVAEAEAVLPLPPAAPTPAVAQLVQSVPLPTPRPPDLEAAPSPMPPRIPFRAPARQFARRGGVAPAPGAPADNRSFFEKLFGTEPQPPGPVLAYAAPESDFFSSRPSVAASPATGYDRLTAVYDISAHTVYMPDGSRLEAHSGLAGRLDDPRYVSERMRGPTPPHLYDLTPREQLFHGVRALRLNPVGGGGSLYGRNGLLAHTFMLGPRGDSNGCVSFRNYNAFLQAFQNGAVKRLAVVARM